jgi:hypothetical protein
MSRLGPGLPGSCSGTAGVPPACFDSLSMRWFFLLTLSFFFLTLSLSKGGRDTRGPGIATFFPPSTRA